jgi:hypothetical protein
MGVSKCLPVDCDSRCVASDRVFALTEFLTCKIHVNNLHLVVARGCTVVIVQSGRIGSGLVQKSHPALLDSGQTRYFGQMSRQSGSKYSVYPQR